MDKKDMYIKSKLQQDNKISNQANEVFRKFEGGIKLENNNKPKERKIFKLGLKQAVLAFSSLMIVAVLGGNLYAHLNGKPNLYSAIKGLFVKEDKYTASEITVDQTVESNGIKLTLKTVAMDENVLITKYIAEAEKLENEFYTYPQFEEDMIKVIKIRNVIAGNDIGESGYDNYTLKDVTTMRKEIVAKLQLGGITEEEAKEVEKIATEAYTVYIGAGLGHEGCTSEKAQELITQTIAMFESKVSSKYQIMLSNDTLQDFNIDVISQKIEKSGNQYIIYNVYNVDTLSDIASKFNLNINIEQIGSTEGTWNFSTELEKARLDTRVETIDFYENNSYNNVAPTITSDKVRHSATVEVKRLVISDFSTVLMIQTKVKEEDREYYLKYAEDGLPCIYVVTNENDDVVGTGTAAIDTYEYACASGGEIKYTDRIILENIDKDTKKLYVKIYEPYYIAEGDTVELNTKTIELDIESARNGKKPVELTQSFVSKEVQVSFKYPGDWSTKETMNDEVILVGPEDVDGNNPTITIGKISKEEYENIKEFTVDYGHETLLEKGEITIAGVKGYYGITTFVDTGMYEKSKIIVAENNEQYYYLRLTTNTDVAYSRYEETFNKILETIKFVEPEKSYRIFSEGRHEVVKLYEDNKLTIAFSEEAIESINHESKFDFEANVEYEIIGVPQELEYNKINVNVLGIYDDHVDISMIYIIEGTNLYYVDIETAKETGKFEIVEEPILRDIGTIVDYATSEVYDNYEKNGNELGSRILHQVKTKDEKIYILDYNSGSGKFNVEEYIEKQEQTEPDTTSKYENMAYESFEIYDGLIKQYEDNTVTVEWNDNITTYESKLWEVNPNIEYIITGLDGKVKSVHNIIKDRQGKDMQAIKILTDKGTLYGRFDLKTDYTLQASNVGIINKVETVVLQQRADTLVVITENDNVCNVNYNMYTVAKAPSKQTIYNCLIDYCESSEKLSLNEPIENVFEYITYLDNGDGNYKADVRIKIFDSSISETKSMRAVIVFDAQNNNFKIETFEENPRGGGGY